MDEQLSVITEKEMFPKLAWQKWSFLFLWNVIPKNVVAIEENMKNISRDRHQYRCSAYACEKANSGKNKIRRGK